MTRRGEGGAGSGQGATGNPQCPAAPEPRVVDGLSGRPAGGKDGRRKRAPARDLLRLNLAAVLRLDLV